MDAIIIRRIQFYGHLEAMKESGLINILHTSNLHRKPTSLQYERVQQDLENINIIETQVNLLNSILKSGTTF